MNVADLGDANNPLNRFVTTQHTLPTTIHTDKRQPN